MRRLLVSGATTLYPWHTSAPVASSPSSSARSTAHVVLIMLVSDKEKPERQVVIHTHTLEYPFRSVA